jgi:pimeloyl-ACP methyl ester carboxylesterase
MGGDRHHPLVVSVAEGLAAAGVAALRIDLRDPDVGTATSQLEEVAADLLAETGVDRLVLVGYSWGAAVACASSPAGVLARVLIAPPVSMLELTPGASPTLVLVPAHDQYGPPDAVRETVASWPAAEIEVVEGCDHFLVGAVARIAQRTAGWLASRL